MANTATKTKPVEPAAPPAASNGATPPTPSFVARPITELPKREPPASREAAPALAQALLAIVTGTSVIDGETVANTATDGVSYADVKAARQAANKAKRALTRVVPDGKIVKSRVWGDDGNVTWSVFLADAPPPEAVAPAASA